MQTAKFCPSVHLSPFASAVGSAQPLRCGRLGAACMTASAAAHDAHDARASKQSSSSSAQSLLLDCVVRTAYTQSRWHRPWTATSDSSATHFYRHTPTAALKLYNAWQASVTSSVLTLTVRKSRMNPPPSRLETPSQTKMCVDNNLSSSNNLLFSATHST